MVNFDITKLSFPLLASVVVAYTTVCGCLWHIGYWSTFQFNFLEFASIGDLFKSTLYPLLSSIWIFGALFLFAIGLSTASAILIVRKPPNNSAPVYSELPIWVTSLLIILFTCTGFAFSGVLSKNKDNWALLSVSLAGLFSCVVFMLGSLKKQIPDDVLRLGIIFILFLIPSLNFGIAKKLSLQTKNMIRYQAVQHISTTDSILNSVLPNSAYLATTNNFHFFYLPQQVIVVKSEDIHSLVLEDTLNQDNYFRWRDDSILVQNRYFR
jgi:hypothetical protein